MFSFEFSKIEYQDASTPFQRRELEHSIAYSLLDKMLNKIGITNYEFVKNENGKPFLKDNGVFFSISHADGLCAVCISDTEIGIDCEKIDQAYAKKIEAFSKRYFLDNEIKLLKESQNPLFDFFKIWTTKEAYIKKYGLNGSHLKKIDTTLQNAEIHIEGEYIISILK